MIIGISNTISDSPVADGQFYKVYIKWVRYIYLELSCLNRNDISENYYCSKMHEQLAGAV